MPSGKSLWAWGNLDQGRARFSTCNALVIASCIDARARFQKIRTPAALVQTDDEVRLEGRARLVHKCRKGLSAIYSMNRRNKIRLVISLPLLLLIGCERRTIGVGHTTTRQVDRETFKTTNGPRLILIGSDDAAKMTPEAKAEADSIFDDRCTACHGSNGDGKGPAALSMNPHPKDFRDAKWQKSVSDEKITKAIVSGGEAVGLTAAMPGNPDLEDRPGVVEALVVHIRKFGK